MADDERLVVRWQLGSTWPLATRTPGRARPQCLDDQPFCVDVVLADGVILRAVVTSRSVVQAGAFVTPPSQQQLWPGCMPWMSRRGSPLYSKCLGLHCRSPATTQATSGDLRSHRFIFQSGATATITPGRRKRRAPHPVRKARRLHAGSCRELPPAFGVINAVLLIASAGWPFL